MRPSQTPLLDENMMLSSGLEFKWSWLY